MSREFFIETKSKKWWKRLLGEKDVTIDDAAIDERNAELEEKLQEGSQELLGGFCPFTNLGNCRSDCNHFSLGKVHRAGLSYWGVYGGDITKTCCKLSKTV